jgi:hypothetical protein
MRLCKVSHEMTLHLELLSAVADVASVTVKRKQFIGKHETSGGLESTEGGFKSLLVILPVS